MLFRSFCPAPRQRPGRYPGFSHRSSCSSLGPCSLQALLAMIMSDRNRSDAPVRSPPAPRSRSDCQKPAEILCHRHSLPRVPPPPLGRHAAAASAASFNPDYRHVFSNSSFLFFACRNLIGHTTIDGFQSGRFLYLKVGLSPMAPQGASAGPLSRTPLSSPSAAALFHAPTLGDRRQGLRVIDEA